MDFEFKHFKNADEVMKWIAEKIMKNNHTEEAYEAWDFINHLYDLAQYYET